MAAEGRVAGNGARSSRVVTTQLCRARQCGQVALPLVPVRRDPAGPPLIAALPPCTRPATRVNALCQPCAEFESLDDLDPRLVANDFRRVRQVELPAQERAAAFRAAADNDDLLRAFDVEAAQGGNALRITNANTEP